MKKLTAILLSLILSLSLAAPAFAAPAEGAPGVWTVDGKPVPVYQPGEAIPISAILDGLAPGSAGSIGIIGGADGPTAIFTTTPVGWGVLLDGSDVDTVTVIEWFKTNHPERVAELRAGARAAFEADRELSRGHTAEEYMEEFGRTEEEFLDEQVERLLFELYYSEGAEWLAEFQKEALGGVAGQVGVMVNGIYIKFPDAVPEVADGTTMVPVRALVEALGGEVEADGAKVVCTSGLTTVTFEMHGFDVKVERRDSEDGEPKTDAVTMPVSAYVKNGRTYVPLRFLAGALGYEVGWDSAYQTVILLDQEALAAKIDENFTILNKVQANKGPVLEEGKSCLADVKESLTLTLFDTLNENKTYKAELTGKQIFNTNAASAQLSLKLSDNALDDLEKLLTEQYGADFEENAALFRTVAEGLDDIEVILTREGSAWFRAAALDELAGEDNVWLDADLGADWGELAFAQAGDTTIGKALARFMPCESVTEWGSAMEMTELLASLFGDSKFTTSGGMSTLTIDVDDLMAIYEDMGLSADDMETAKAAFKEYEIVMKVDSKGRATMTCVMESAAQTGVPGMKITMDVKQADGNVTMDMNFHIANMGEMKVEVTQTQKATTDKPMAEPPEGAIVVESIEPLAF